MSTIELNFATQKTRLLKRLQGYWKLERLNIFLLPAAALFVVSVNRSPITIALALSLFATALLLVIGTVALRIMLKVLEHDSSYADYWLPKLQIAKTPSWLLILLCNFVTLYESFRAFPNFTLSQYAALAFTVLATLEYINYYHRQLQHFDNAADFRRLLAGVGFRKSHLARALRKWQRKQASGS